MAYDISVLEFSNQKRRIVREIIQNPGINPSEMSQSLEISTTSLSNQLNKLCTAGIIYFKRKGKISHYFIAEEFIIYNPEYRVSKSSQELTTNETLENSNIIISLIKNVLYNSSSTHAPTILDNWDIFMTWFSIQELIILLYELGICIDIDKESLFVANMHYSPAMREELMERYEDVCCYISVQNEEFQPKRFYK